MKKKYFSFLPFFLLVLSGCSLIEKAPEKQPETTQDETNLGEIDWNEVREEDLGSVEEETLAYDTTPPNKAEKDPNARPYQVVNEPDGKTLNSITESDSSFKAEFLANGEDGRTFIVKVTNVSNKNLGAIVKIVFYDKEGALLETQGKQIAALGPNGTVCIDFYNVSENRGSVEVFVVEGPLYGTPAEVSVELNMVGDKPDITVRNNTDKDLFVRSGQLIAFDENGVAVSLENVSLGLERDAILPKMEKAYGKIDVFTGGYPKYEIYFQPLILENNNKYMGTVK